MLLVGAITPPFVNLLVCYLRQATFYEVDFVKLPEKVRVEQTDLVVGCSERRLENRRGIPLPFFQGLCLGHAGSFLNRWATCTRVDGALVP